MNTDFIIVIFIGMDLKCNKVDGPSTLSQRNDSVLLFVKSYIPERFDRHILKYKWIPNTVIIEKST